MPICPPCQRRASLDNFPTPRRPPKGLPAPPSHRSAGTALHIVKSGDRGQHGQLPRVTDGSCGRGPLLSRVRENNKRAWANAPANHRPAMDLAWLAKSTWWRQAMLAPSFEEQGGYFNLMEHARPRVFRVLQPFQRNRLAVMMPHARVHRAPGIATEEMMELDMPANSECSLG